MRNDAESQRGFTLLELLVVIVVLGLALGLVAATAPAESPAVRLDSAAARVAGALRLARTEAITRDRPVGVLLDPRRRTLRIESAPAWRLPVGVAVLPDGASGPVQVTFAPDGTAAGGPVVLAVPGLRREIAANWLTGRVEEAYAAPER